MTDKYPVQDVRYDSGSDESPVGEKHIGLDRDDPLGVLHAVADPDAGCSLEERLSREKKTMWKVDLYLIPWLSLLYLMAFLDRTNIGNAKIDGLQKDLKMTNNQYNLTLTVFFITYAIFEPITQVLLKRLRPSIFIPAIMCSWAICMTLMGIVTNFKGLLVARFFLGLTEAGLFPGVQFYLSCWYKRSEFGVRAALFFSAAALAGSFGGLLAVAIAKIGNVGIHSAVHLHAWNWIFIVEGLATFVIGVISFWVVQDFPDEAKFLTNDERARVLRRLAADKQASSKHEDFQSKYLWQVLKDWKTYTGMIIYMGADGALYSFSLFLPTIVKNLGYTATRAQLLTVPPYAVAAILTVVVGFVADRTRQRGIINMSVAIVGVTGFAMLISTKNPHIQYAGTFLGAMGIYPTIANTITWTANNFEGVYARGLAMGFVIGWGNLNGIVSSNIYRAHDAPRFIPGHAVVIGYLGLFLFGGSLVQYLGLRWENSRRRAGKLDYIVEGKTQQQIDDLGDKRPDFMYTL